MAAYDATLVMWIGAGFAAGAGTIRLRRERGWIATVLFVVSLISLVAALQFGAR